MGLCAPTGERHSGCGGFARCPHQRVGEAGLGGAGLLQVFAQIGAEATQLFDAGDDAVLFGEGWDRQRERSNVALIHGLLASSRNKHSRYLVPHYPG